MNTAKKYLHVLLDVPEHDEADLVLATQQTRIMRDRYNPPHKMRGTPPRDTRRTSSILAPRLFKGYRP